jgi:hypothetical protein
MKIINLKKMAFVRGVCKKTKCADFLTYIFESLNQKHSLSGHIYNRHFLKFEIPPSTINTNPSHQSEFSLPFSLNLKSLLKNIISGKVGEILEESLGKDAELCEITSITSDPGARSQDFHSDSFWRPTTPKLITMFLALHDILEENLGPTRFCPNTHAPHCFPDGKWTAPTELVDSMWFPLRAGDLVMMDSFLWHCGGENKSEKQRTILGISFIESSNSSDECPRLKDFL